MAAIKDPENSILMTLKGGTVTIELLPDVAPPPQQPDEGTGPRRGL